MPGEQKATRTDLCTETLRDAENDTADQRSPQRPDAAGHLLVGPNGAGKTTLLNVLYDAVIQ